MITICLYLPCLNLWEICIEVINLREKTYLRIKRSLCRQSKDEGTKLNIMLLIKILILFEKKRSKYKTL